MSIDKDTPRMTSVTTPTPALIMVNHGDKSEKVNSTDFKRWQQKMLFVSQN